MGCKVPTDLVKISIEEAMHMSFYYMTSLGHIELTFQENKVATMATDAIASFITSSPFC